MTRDAIMAQLSQPFPDGFVHKNPSGGGSYVKHHVVNQRLIQVFGRPPNFERVEIIFGDVDAIEPNPDGKSERAKKGRPALKGVVVGVVARLSIAVDGEPWIAEEAGDCEDPHNWTTDGQRLKDAMSDAYKRCAMRWGCGLHLWSQNEYFLFDQLSGEARPSQPTSKAGGEVSPEPLAKSEDTKSEEPEAQSGSGPDSQPETSPDSAGGEADSAQPMRGSDESADPPSEEQLVALIQGAITAGKTTEPKVNTATIRAASRRQFFPEGGIAAIGWQNCPAEVLADVIQKLGLEQGALV